ncbi:MAG: SWIM zinc finger family protein [Erysipelotrichaceae bacterium]|nr:SWIM zinc finger family protein [Erysipelotrichaceae bacterium]
MQWQDLFSSNILDRGYDYYMSDNILEMKHQSHYLLARIKGEKDYQVKIDLDNIENMSCECQYFQSGNYCKHLAAVLFAYDDKPMEVEEEVVDINDIIGSFSKNQLQQILKELTSKDENVKNYVLSLSQNISLSLEHQRIKDIFDHYRIIDDLPDVFVQLHSWLTLGYYQECFEIVKDIYERLIKLVKQHEYFDECQSILEVILNDGDDSLKETLYQWLMHLWDFEIQYPMVETLLFEKDYFKDKYELKELLFNSYKQNQNRQDYYSQYRLKLIKTWLKKF